MVRDHILAIGAAAFLGLGACAGAADAAGAKGKSGAPPAAPAAAGSAPAAPAPAGLAIEDCSGFYDPYANRGFGWGSGPGRSVGFGTFEGALPQYPMNSFPNWYGACVNWGNHSSSGSAH